MGCPLPVFIGKILLLLIKSIMFMLNMSTIAGSIQLTIAQVPIVAGSFFFILLTSSSLWLKSYGLSRGHFPVIVGDIME